MNEWSNFWVIVPILILFYWQQHKFDAIEKRLREIELKALEEKQQRIDASNAAMLAAINKALAEDDAARSLDGLPPHSSGQDK